jgi:acyl carrier protein
MTREEVFSVIQNHLRDELDVDPARIDESTPFKEDLDADSLDLYTLVQELEDSYGVKITDEQATGIQTVGAGRRLRPRPRRRQLSACRSCAHCSTSCRRSCTAGVHARLVDRAAVGLLLAPGVPGRLGPGARRDDLPVPAPGGGALRGGRLTKIRAQAVSGPSCRAVAERLGVPERLRETAPEGVGQSAATLVETERVLASVIEAVIGACYLQQGYEPTAEAVVEAFMPEIERALEPSGRLQVDAARSAWRGRAERWTTR